MCLHCLGQPRVPETGAVRAGTCARVLEAVEPWGHSGASGRQSDPPRSTGLPRLESVLDQCFSNFKGHTNPPGSYENAAPQSVGLGRGLRLGLSNKRPGKPLQVSGAHFE